MKLIVGLGNPGKDYENTRHNIGFMVINELIKKENNARPKEKFNGLYYEYKIDSEKIILLKPQSYINLSGSVVDKFVHYYDINTEDILIISDDLDLEVGKYKLKPAGGSGGHNGLKNIEYYLQTDQYKRLRIGISNNKDINTRDYVLGEMSSDEKGKILNVIDVAVNIIYDFPKYSFSDLMNKYNKR